MSANRSKTLDLILAGRAGIDLNTGSLNCPFSEVQCFTKSVGGSPANIVQGAQRLGLRTGFIGKIACDGMGEYILESFRAQGIDTAGLVLDHTGARNCLALTEILSPAQSGGYASDPQAFHHGTYLYREKTADLLLSPDDIDEDYVASARAVLISGTALSQSPSREAMMTILTYAKRHGTQVLMDIDYRPFGWTDRAETARVYAAAIAQCDGIIGNREEFDAIEFLEMPENRDNRRSAEALLAKGVQLVIVKDGAAGSWGYPAGGEIVRCGAIATQAIKTFGSGDAYAAGLLFGRLTGRPLADSIALGTACASLALTGISCADAMPTLAAAEAHLRQHPPESGVAT